MESQKNSHKDRIARIGCITSIVIPLVAIVLFIAVQFYNLHPDRDLFVADQSHSFDVAYAFAHSLSINSMDEMKSYLAEEKWSFLNGWINVHEPISKMCHFPWDPDLRGIGVGGSKTPDSISISMHFIYDCPNYGYKFEFRSLELKLIDEKWQITNWEKICEQKGNTKMCLNDDSLVWQPEHHE